MLLNQTTAIVRVYMLVSAGQYIGQNLITQHMERYAAPCDTVSDRTLFNALLNRHGATVRRGEGKL